MSRDLMCCLLASLGAAGCVSTTTDTTELGLRTDPVEIQLLNVSDWHGQLDQVNGIGGAAVISAYWQNDRAANPNSFTFTAGDAFGGTPPLSSYFNDEPAILAMNLMGFDADTFGNHNFDKGTAFLQHLIDLADFKYIASNLENLEGNLEGVHSVKTFRVGPVKVGVVGLVNPEAPELTKPGALGTLVIADPAPAAMAARDRLRASGAEVVIVICHLGVTRLDGGVPSGPLIDFANAVSGFDVIFGDHTDIRYSGIINGQLVVENLSKGMSYARTRITVQPDGTVSGRSSQFVTPFASGVTPDPAIVSLLEPYRTELKPILSTVIGTSSVVMPRADACGNSLGRTCESKVGDVIADALRGIYGAEFAITNSGGIRADMTCPTTDNPDDFCPAFTAPPYLITRGQVQTVLPFGNEVVTLTVSGAELKQMLENGVSIMPAVNGRFPQVSGLCFTYDIARPAGSRVTGAVRQAADGSCTGAAIDLTSTSSYMIAENDFMVAGGDGYPNLNDRAVSRDMMDQVVADWIGANSPVGPSIQGRIQCTTSGATACPIVTP